MDAVFVEFSAGLSPSIAPSVPAESVGFIRFSFPAILSFLLVLCAMLSQADKKTNNNLVLQNKLIRDADELNFDVRQPHDRRM